MSPPVIADALELERVPPIPTDFGTLAVPFGDDEAETPCHRCDGLSVDRVEFDGHPPIGLLALSGPRGGVYEALDASGLRALASAALRVANGLDGGRGVQ